MKLCYKCNQTKPVADFNKRKASADGLQHYCRDCTKEKHKQWHKENPSFALLRNYGITLEEKLAMITKQSNCCAICKEKFGAMKHTHVDHCHTTGKIRGILCNHCNRGLGSFKDSPKLLQRAIHYVEYHATKNTTTPVPAGHYSKSEEHTKHGTVLATGTREDDDNAYHHCGTISREDLDHRAQASSGDGVAHRNKKVEPSRALTGRQDNGQPDAEIIRLEFGRRDLFD